MRSYRKLTASMCWVATVIIVGASLVIALTGTTSGVNPSSEPVIIAIVLTFATVGLMLVLKVPDNHIGWIFCAGGLLAATWVVSQTYYEAARSDALAGIGYAAWLSQAVYFPMILCLVSLPLLLFPSGQIPSRSWRWVLWVIIVVAALAVVTATLQPQFTDSDGKNGIYEVDNPFGVPAAADFLSSPAMGVIGLILIALSLLAPAAAMVYRFRKSKGVERLQLKWLAYSAILAGVGLAGFYMAQQWVPETALSLQILVTVALIGVLGVPVTAGVAITRYHLYDIDRLISRTISYGLLAAVLALVYSLGVFLLGTLAFHGATQVAVSTLVVAALFNPLRRRLHNLLDQRFSRSTYSPTEVINGFSRLIRDEVDVNSLIGDLLGVIDSTLAPSQRSVWIRDRPV